MSTNKFLDQNGLNTYHAGVVNALNKKASKDNSVYFIRGTSTTAGIWTGSEPKITEYYDGLTILYRTNVSGGASSTTLNINNLGAKTIYRHSNTMLTTQIGANSTVLLTYVVTSNNSYWIVASDNDSESITNDEIDSIMSLI